ncbi:Uncharacterised protein [Vibrio cholerae]|nr:Uncharacterised protein [Vibrio cholerae]
MRQLLNRSVQHDVFRFFGLLHAVHASEEFIDQCSFIGSKSTWALNKRRFGFKNHFHFFKTVGF